MTTSAVSARTAHPSPTRLATSHLLRNCCQDLVQPLHELLEGGALRGHSVPALPHQHVPGDKGVLAGSHRAPCPPTWPVLTARGCSWMAGPCGAPPSAA